MSAYACMELVAPNVFHVVVDRSLFGLIRIDLSILLRNIAMAGAMERMFRLGTLHDRPLRTPYGIIHGWSPNVTGRSAP